MRVEDCYQCGKCTAGCPVAERMDVMPNQMVRLAQIGDTEAMGRARSAWLCVSCQACTERCPKGVDVAGVMDEARQRSAYGDRLHPRSVRTAVFQESFLDSIRRHGRLFELDLIASYKFGGFVADHSVPKLLADATLAPRLLRRKKLHLRPDRVRDRKLVGRIVDRCVDDEDWG